jgi:hypothetical protein
MLELRVSAEVDTGTRYAKRVDALAASRLPTPTLLHLTRGSLVILVHSRDAPRQDDWKRYVEALGGYVKDPNCTILVVGGAGPGPSAVQRDMLAGVVPKRVRTAVLTESVLARGIVTLLAWFHENIRAFAPPAIEGAFDYLEVPRIERPLILKTIKAMQDQLEGRASDPRIEAVTSLQEAAIAPMDAAVARLESLRDKLAARRRE